MQNCYTGDIGDFGKLGLLRWVGRSGLSIGVNWYLVQDETDSNDGRYTSYLKKDTFCSCDEDLCSALQSIVASENREVKALETSGILNAKFFSDALDLSKTAPVKRNNLRLQWHTSTLSHQNLRIKSFQFDSGIGCGESQDA